MKPLNILISNDDGVFAAGIRALAKSAQKKGHNVKVVCPDQERSATGHGPVSYTHLTLPTILLV